MATLKIMGQSKIQRIKKQFKKDVGVDIQIYDQDGNNASDDISLGSIRSETPKSTELKIVGQSKVRTVEKYFQNNYGVKVDILNPDGTLADNDVTLSDIRKLYEGGDSASDRTTDTNEKENIIEKYLNKDIPGTGYRCGDCGADEAFEGDFDIYRLYTKGNPDGFDFEIVAPSKMVCCECDSENIVVDIEEGFALDIEDTELCTDLCLVEKKLICFDSYEGWRVLFKMLGCSDIFCEKGEHISDTEMFADFDKFEITAEDFQENNEIVLEITASGIVENEEGILLDSGSTYKNCRIARME